MTDRAPLDRHYGLDWLRIGAFALLILYHVTMVFSPWDWVIKWPETSSALIAPMALLTPWRLPLLFAVSGFATRRLMARTGPSAEFVRGRSMRLLVPLAFALAVLLPPELWVRMRQAGYAGGLAGYWRHDYWLTTPYHGFAFPNWEHLWFVAYLWTYTIALVALLLAVGGAARVQQAIERALRGGRLVWLPIAALAAMKLALMFVVPERNGLTSDWAGHAENFPLFVFGFALGGSSALWAGIARHWRGGALAAGVSAIVVVGVELRWPGHAVPPHAVMALDRAARLAMAWGMILMLLRAADVWWNRDHPLRAPLAEAVFPAYLIHQPALVLLTWYLRPTGLAPLPAFALLLSGTAAACIATYLIGRDAAWLRPLIGLGPRKAAPRAAIAPA